MKKESISPHVNEMVPHVEEKSRIDCLVSREVKDMWNEITARDQAFSEKRYFPAHTLERMIRAEYQLMKAFGRSKDRKRKND